MKMCPTFVNEAKNSTCGNKMKMWTRRTLYMVSRVPCSCGSSCLERLAVLYGQHPSSGSPQMPYHLTRHNFCAQALSQLRLSPHSLPSNQTHFLHSGTFCSVPSCTLLTWLFNWPFSIGNDPLSSLALETEIQGNLCSEAFSVQLSWKLSFSFNFL